MSWKSTGILLFAAAVLFAFVWLVERPIRQARLRQSSRVILPGFDPASVNSIEIRPRAGSEIHAERLERSPDLWRMTQPIAYPARNTPIMAMLEALAKLSWQDRISPDDLKNQPDAQEKFGFSQPQVEIALRGSSMGDKILIGQSSAYGDQVFLEVVGDPDIYRVSAEILSSIPADKDQWRDRSLFDLDAVPWQSIAARSPARGIEFELERDPTNHLWFMNKPVQARADNSKINELLGRLKALQVQQFVTDDAKADLELYGLQSSAQTPDLDLSFWQGTNLAAELQIGASPTNQPDAAYARRLEPSNVVVVARGQLSPWQGAYTNFLDYHFISVSPETINAIAVQGENRFVVQKETNGQWQVRGQTTFPADPGLMRAWLSSFTNIETQIEATVATDFAKYGLAKPLLQYTLQSDGASNAVIARLEFGVNKSGRVFERRRDELSLNYINPGDFERLPRAPWQLRDRRIWSFDSSNVLSLTIHQLGATRKFLRDPDGGWTFAPGFHGPPMVNWPAIEEGIHRLGDLQAIYWSGVGVAHWSDFGFSKADFSLTIELKFGDKTETRDIQFGGRSPYTYPYASVELNGQRLIFEFPVDLYENFVEPHMTIPAALRYNQ